MGDVTKGTIPVSNFNKKRGLEAEMAPSTLLILEAVLSGFSQSNDGIHGLWSQIDVEF